MKNSSNYLLSILSLSLLIFSIIGCSQSKQQEAFIHKDKLDTYFVTLNENNKFMGSVTLAKQNEIIYQTATGFSNVEKKIKADHNTLYCVGSISKTFTAVLILKAVEEKRLSLSDTLVTFFPQIDNAKNITLEQMLYHRSGIYNITNEKDFFKTNTQKQNKEEMLKRISDHKNLFTPNSKMEYSNSNYILLSYILEKVYDKSYSQLIKEYITIPLQLTNTYYSTDIKENEALSYALEHNGWKKQNKTSPTQTIGAGGIISTSKEIVLFIQAIFNYTLLSKESTTKMTTLIDDLFGMGLFQVPFYTHLGYSHTGGIDGFQSIWVYIPDDKVTLALTSNAMDYDLNAIAIAALSTAYDMPFEIPSFETIEVNPEELAQYTGLYVSNELPLSIRVFIENNTLKAQATEQPSFPLKGTQKDVFTFDNAGIVMEFKVKEKSMILKQRGMSFDFQLKQE